MKAMIAFLLIGATQLYAETFNFVNQNPVILNSSDSYSLISPVKVEIDSVKAVDFKSATVKVTLNGEEKTVKLNMIDSYREIPMTYTRYEGSVKTDYITYRRDGQVEKVEYIIAFTYANEFTHFSYIEDASLRAKVDFTFDYHSETETTVYPYTVQ